MKWSTASTGLCIVFALGVAPALAAAEWSFSDIDQDGSGEIASPEFEQITGAVFKDWDADDDQELNDAELYRGLFMSFDVDQDGALTEQEYEAGTKSWFGDEPPVAFDAMAADGTGAASSDTFTRAMSDAGAINSAGPGDMQYTAFHDALFGLYDRDGDDAIAEAEYALMSQNRLVGGPATVPLTNAESGTGSALTSGRTGAAGTDATAGDTRTDVPASD